MSKFNLALTGENKVIDCLEQKDWKKKKKKKRKKNLRTIAARQSSIIHLRAPSKLKIMIFL
jgi:hypothetical protein